MQRALLIAASALAVAACNPAAETPSTPSPPAAVELPKTVSASRDVIPHAQLPDTVLPSAYRLDLVIDPTSDTMDGMVEIDAAILEATDGFWMHAKEMSVSDASITLGETTYPLTFDAISPADAPSGVAWMQAAETLPKGNGVIRIAFSTPFNQNLNSAYKVVRGNDAYIVTQMEPLGAREAFPGFDEPKYKQPFTLSITSPSENVVVSNTPVTSETAMDGGMVKHQFAQTRPLPTYLVAFAVGPYDVVDYGMIPPNEFRTRPLALRGLAARGEGKRLNYALDNTDGILSALEGYFGREYPYEKLDLIAAPEYAFGAMENPGLIVYRESLLLLDDNAPLSQKRSYARVHSHELAHQWFGNLVTPVWWEDIWLNEAFATWMGNKGLTLWQPDGNFDNMTLNASLGAMNIDSLSTTRRVREPLDRSENVMDQFDGITYRKGGGVLDMFESYVGDANFQKGVRLHMDRYADDVATGDDFFQSIADGSGNPDVVAAMKSFVDQKGLPLITASSTCGDGPSTIISLRQSRYAPLGSQVEQGQKWEIPVCASVVANGKTSKHCTLLKDEEDDLNIEGICADAIMPNADAAGYYRFTLPRSGWTALMANLDNLTTKEVLSAQDSLVAGFRAGEVDAVTFLSGMKAFADHPDYDVASGSTELLSFIYDEFPDARDGLAAHIRATYGNRYRAIRGQDTVEGNLLSPLLGALLANAGQDQEAKNYLIKQGSVYLGLDGDTAERRARVPSNLLSNAFRETMRARPDAAYDPLLALATSGSPLEKGAALGALTATPDRDQAERLLALAIADGSPLTGRQSGTIINGLLGNEAHAGMAWEWYKTKFDDYMVRKVPDVRRGRAPSAANRFCSTEKRDEARAFFTSKAAVIPGYERSLAQAIERIELCAALKDTQGPTLVAALKRSRRLRD
ncbi:MAG: M1 family metallopeptidase [Litorimonas sp.]